MNKHNNKAWLQSKYVGEHLNCRQIGKLCGASKRTVHSWLVKHGIPRRPSGWEMMPEDQKELRRKWNKAHPEVSRMSGKHHSEETKRLMSEARRGSGNANWKGGITAKIRKIRHSKEYQKWRRLALRRDGHRCVECGATESLHVHHKESIFKHPEKIFDVDNGITLCENHHIPTYAKKETAYPKIKN